MIYATPRTILAAVSERFGISLDELTGPRKSRTVVKARFVAMALLREQQLSYPEIGRALGNRDHTTVMIGLRKVPADPTLTAHVEHLRASLEGKAA